MARSITPLGDRVLVRPVEREEITRGGIVLPDTVKEKPQEGEVVAVGPGRKTDEGKNIPIGLEQGDIIIYAKYGGTELKEDGEDFLFLSERDIMAKIA